MAQESISSRSMPTHSDRKSSGEWGRQDKAQFRELVAAGKVRCRCHGKPLVAHKGQRRWRCPVKQAADARYDASENGRASRARYAKRRYKSPGYFAARARYYSNASGAYGRWCELRREGQEYAAMLREKFRHKQLEERAKWEATYKEQFSDFWQRCVPASASARSQNSPLPKSTRSSRNSSPRNGAPRVAKLERTA
jgi:hypothetical protein